jgi:hypothetical protein
MRRGVSNSVAWQELWQQKRRNETRNLGKRILGKKTARKTRRLQMMLRPLLQPLLLTRHLRLYRELLPVRHSHPPLTSSPLGSVAAGKWKSRRSGNLDG